MSTSASSNIRVRIESGQWCPVNSYQNAAFQQLRQAERIALHTKTTIVCNQDGHHFTLCRHPNHHVHGGILLTNMSGDNVGTQLPMLDWNAIKEFRWCDAIKTFRWQPVSHAVKEAYACFLFDLMEHTEQGSSSHDSNGGGGNDKNKTQTETLTFMDEQGRPTIMYRNYSNGGCIVYRCTEEHVDTSHCHEIRVSDHLGYKRAYMAYYRRQA